ncbi:hypothetical protein MLD38_018905 [Melastoma candidum]|uniref:Uncharacterized protein n=1 Tax=Melastoma candidum TaxID=119954 RepID=A0ACB9QWL5_9MYRT|nr:hypothetical protein MLD38_018905 [Melastoma candidum]
MQPQPHNHESEELRYRVKHWKVKEIDARVKWGWGECPDAEGDGGSPRGSRFSSLDQDLHCGREDLWQNRTRDLREKFPNLHDHLSLATEEELRQFKGRQNRLAARDYLITLESDMLVYTYDGNMTKAVQRHGKFEGFRKASLSRGSL